MKKAVLIAVVLIVLLIFSSIRIQAQDFVKVKGKQFEIGGKRYCFLGTNLWYGCNLGSLGAGGDRERLVRELDHLKSLGISNVRVLGASEGAQFNTVRPSLQPKPGEYDEELLKGLDFLLAELAKRGMYAVIYLNNYWVWSGGMSQYVAWGENRDVPNPFKEGNNWDEFMRYSAKFYRNKEANQQYRIYIEMLVSRINSCSGLCYRDDPAIMAWQLANEPRPGDGLWGEANFAVFREWIDETATFIKVLDPNHLVSTGNEGTAGSMWSEKLYRDIHRSENIDYMTVHLWILNWRWYDPLHARKTYPKAEKQALKYLRQHIDFADELGKPLILEEFGIPRDRHSYFPAATTKYRDRFFSQIFSTIYKNAKQSGPLTGSNFWTWSGEGLPRDPQDARWIDGDPLTGDPPQEPQGRNSVFDHDESTLKILRNFAEKMNQLCE